jgi:hypothetical protein
MLNTLYKFVFTQEDRLIEVNDLQPSNIEDANSKFFVLKFDKLIDFIEAQ